MLKKTYGLLIVIRIVTSLNQSYPIRTYLQKYFAFKRQGNREDREIGQQQIRYKPTGLRIKKKNYINTMTAAMTTKAM